MEPNNICSMTGFGRANETIDGYDISVEMRSVNHRYLEVTVRVPRSYSFLEEPLRQYLLKQILRGKVEVSVQIWQIDKSDVVIEPNIPISRGYMNALKNISEELELRFDVGAATISRFPDVFNITAAKPDEEAILQNTMTVLDKALTSFSLMRQLEGSRLIKDIEARLTAIENTVSEIETAAREGLDLYREKITSRMNDILSSSELDENRILLEAALYADRSAIDEETVRLKSHIIQFRQILESELPVGRKLDFLLQELNREINTIGSKSNDFGLASKVVDTKAEIEKIREQIQNIE